MESYSQPQKNNEIIEDNETDEVIDNFNFNLYKFMIIKKNAQQTVRDLTWINRAKKMINLDQ